MAVSGGDCNVYALIAVDAPIMKMVYKMHILFFKKVLIILR